MTKQAYWIAVLKKNPALSNDDATITQRVRCLRRLVEQAYDMGFQHAQMEPKGIPNFESIFGGKTK